MTTLFGRSWRLEVGSILIESNSSALGQPGPESLRFSFSVERDKSQDPNKAELAIWNLNREHREALAKSDTTVRLMCGYRNSLDLMFFGVLRKAVSETDDSDGSIVTRLAAGDSESKLINNQCSKSFAKGALVADVLSYLAGSLDVKKGNLDKFKSLATLDGSPVLTRAVALRGSSASEMSEFCRAVGFQWCVIDGELQVNPNGIPAGQGPLLSAETGLMGSPQLEPKGRVSFQCRLMPGILPGWGVVLAAKNTKGLCVVEKTRHYGDTHDNNWTIDALGEIK